MIKEQKFKKEYAYELLKIARGDYETAEVLASSNKGRKENICFNSQQVIEKSLKAVLCYKELPVPFTRSIDILLDRLKKEEAFSSIPSLNELTEYATVRRYEEGTFELDSEDLVSALELARKVLEVASSIIK